VPFATLVSSHLPPPTTQRWVVGIALFLALGAFVAVGSFGALKYRQLLALQTDLARVQPAAQAQQSPAAPLDFTAQLALLPNDATVLQTLNRACQPLGVLVESAGIARPPSAPADLSLLTLTLNLRGGYSQTKAVLTALLGRWPGAALQSLRVLPTDDASATVQTQAVLVLWGLPTLQQLAPGPTSTHTQPRQKAHHQTCAA
jgi:NAD(P)-dependent dehydrogenase (short-subunit alcohol dehydrogenase family)